MTKMTRAKIGGSLVGIGLAILMSLYVIWLAVGCDGDPILVPPPIQDVNECDLTYAQLWEHHTEYPYEPNRPNFWREYHTAVYWGHARLPWWINRAHYANDTKGFDMSKVEAIYTAEIKTKTAVWYRVDVHDNGNILHLAWWTMDKDSSGKGKIRRKQETIRRKDVTYLRKYKQAN